MSSIKKLILLCVLFLPLVSVTAEKRIKIACVGNSITYGADIPNRNFNSYPAQLQDYLGKDYWVRNFGVSGTTFLTKGDHPYINSDEFSESKAFEPDIVFIKLGTNDSKPQNIADSANLKRDYQNLISQYRQLPSKPRIIILSPVRCFLKNESINDSIIQNVIKPVIEDVAYENNIEIIDLYRIYGDKASTLMMPDMLHPSSIGAGVIADKLSDYLKTERTKASKIKFEMSNTFNFHGYKGYKYELNGVQCMTVEPKVAAKGNPWVIRALFWNHEPQTDIELLENGFYVAYCDVTRLYGSPKAVNLWNDFYAMMRKKGMNKKVVLEGLSRGGLIAYNWAAQNTDKVACIYGDAPVMDIKSWPLGKGGFKGSPEDIDKMKLAYGFNTFQDIIDWKGNPLDHAEKLANARIPMIHVVGDADDVVPVNENTALFEAAVANAGHTLTVIHKPGTGHHPHSLYNPKPIVQFILRATGRYKNKCLTPIRGNEYRSGAGWKAGNDWNTVADDIQKTLENRKLKLLLLGNSITQGFGGNRESVTYKIGKKAMDDVMGEGNWETAGISGDHVQHLLWRVENGNYNTCKPENVIITIGINNLYAGVDSPDDIAEGIINLSKVCVKKFPSSRIILFGMLPATLDSKSEIRKKCDRIHEVLANTKIKNVEYINPTSWFTLPTGKLNMELYSNDQLHLSGYGYEVWSKKIAEIVK